MSKFYSKTTAGFYDDGLHGPREIEVIEGEGEAAVTTTKPNPNCKIPADAVEITDDAWRALLAAQSKGKIIRPDAKGNPIAVDP